MVLLVVFSAVDGVLASCMATHFKVYGFNKIQLFESVVGYSGEEFSIDFPCVCLLSNRIRFPVPAHDQD